MTTENRNAGEVQLTLREAQLAELEILLAFDAFCKKHGLRMYLCGGTLLGAVRHGGFIPWDDDVDVFMPRPDYDRLVEICRTETIGEDLELANFKNGGLMRAFSKLYFTKSRVERRYHKPMAGRHIWIDVLPVDGLPDDPEATRKLMKLRSYIGKLNYNAMWKVGTGSSRKIIIRRWLYYPAAALVGAKGWARLLDRMARRRPYAKSPTVGCFIGGRYGAGEAMPREKFEIPVPITFEGREFRTMSCYKEYLTGIYGDYMTPPPEHRRTVHMAATFMEEEACRALRAKYPEIGNP